MLLGAAIAQHRLGACADEQRRRQAGNDAPPLTRSLGRHVEPAGLPRIGDSHRRQRGARDVHKARWKGLRNHVYAGCSRLMGLSLARCARQQGAAQMYPRPRAGGQSGRARGFPPSEPRQRNCARPQGAQMRITAPFARAIIASDSHRQEALFANHAMV